MRKSLFTVMTTMCMSLLIAIPVQAARPDLNSTPQPFDPSVEALPVGWTEEDANTEVLPIEEDAAIMEAFGGVEKYRASYEVVTPEYFKSVYAEVAKTLQPQIDTTNNDTIVNSVAVAVNNHFTKDFSVAINAGLFYDYSTRMFTDYVAEGRLFGSYPAAVLVSTMLTANGISNDIYDNYVNHNAGVIVVTEDGYYISIGLYRVGTVDALVKTEAPAGIYNEPIYKMNMGAYKDYLK
ncbi:hypothetical protein [Hungatella effluvii]|uniref:hypothetical protein n=1 Tax=Hungatella effluvii TaxID=1096246 RepID=UPI002A822630|nr:hypothetical protein [Hungatella effluvii]